MTFAELEGTVINQYKIIKLIGTGAYGLVFLVEDIYTNKQYAIKIISKKSYTPKSKTQKQSDILLSKLVKVSNHFNSVLTGLNSIDLKRLVKYQYDPQRESFLKEIIIHLTVHDHPNVISIHEILDSSFCLFIVMDYFPEGDLFHNIVDNQIYLNSSPSLIKTVFIQLIDVLSYCHSKNIYHCDLKPENIMCDLKGSKLVIGDFGLSVTEKNINVKTCIGSSYYMPPERLITANNSNSEINPDLSYPADKGDIWSLSIILINLTCMRNPWMKACSTMDSTYATFLKSSRVLKDILPINDSMYKILKKSLRENPFERISLFQLRDLVSRCETFTTKGSLSIPDIEESSIDEEILMNGCLVPDYLESPLNSDDYQINTNNYQTLLDEYESSKLKDVEIMDHHNEELENYSILTNASFNINEGYFNKPEINNGIFNFNVNINMN